MYIVATRLATECRRHCGLVLHVEMKSRKGFVSIDLHPAGCIQAYTGASTSGRELNYLYYKEDRSRCQIFRAT